MDDSDYWFPPPVAVKLSLSRGQWISIRRDLTWGEQQDAYKRTYVPGAEGKAAPDPVLYVSSSLVAYLLDWSLRDADGPIAIRDRSADEVMLALRNLSGPAFAEIRDAIEAHAAARKTYWEQEKKLPRTTGDAATSLSPSAAVGALSGSVS